MCLIRVWVGRASIDCCRAGYVPGTYCAVLLNLKKSHLDSAVRSPVPATHGVCSFLILVVYSQDPFSLSAFAVLLSKNNIVSLSRTADRHSGIGGGGGSGHRSWSLLLSDSHETEALALRGAQCAALATLRLFFRPSFEESRCGVFSHPQSPMSSATNDAAAQEISAGPNEKSPDREESSPAHKGQHHLSGLEKENPSGREEDSAAREEDSPRPGEGTISPGRGEVSVGIAFGGDASSGGGNVGGGVGGRASPAEVLMAVREALLTKTPLLAGLVRCLVGVVAFASSGPDGGGVVGGSVGGRGAAAAEQSKRAGCSREEGEGGRTRHR